MLERKAPAEHLQLLFHCFSFTGVNRHIRPQANVSLPVGRVTCSCALIGWWWSNGRKEKSK